jgi:hypothetical protein
MNDHKVVYYVSRAFRKAVEQRSDVSPLYEATDRHGITEWAAELQRHPRWSTFISLAVWEIEPFAMLGVQASVALVVGGAKAVTDFAADVSVSHGYDDLVATVYGLLSRALKVPDAEPTAVEIASDDAVYAFAAKGQTGGLSAPGGAL